MPVFTTASSLRARRASRTASLITVDNNTALTPKHPAAAEADPATRPTSPSVPLESESLVLKAKRAYEHDRQRTKKRKERAERERERERNASESHPTPTQGAGRRTGTKLPRIALGAGFGMGDENASPLLSPGVEEIIADVVEREAQARGAVQPLEVHLEQFVKPSKTRKSKAGEFELVPGMPGVIALDDQMPDDAELDEPWEHISADELDEKRVVPPSYATIVAKAL
ncbi:hypothetical protein C8Q74DRAFT_1314555 [Fomes fomentarius]|nr:hypothetical protein C8Q74DRAFT_1314555 [Fomes fomentarius]